MHKLRHVGSSTENTQKVFNLVKHDVCDVYEYDNDSDYNQNYIRVLQGKLHLLQEKNMNLQRFYQQKIAYLKFILLQQKDQKNDLKKELLSLRKESQQQNQYLSQIRNYLEGEIKNAEMKSMRRTPLVSNFNANRQKKRNYKRNKSRGKLFGGSSKLGYSHIKIKKCKSQELFQSQRANNTPSKANELVQTVQNLQTCKYRGST